jgi:DnaJ-class molecular chaperone
MTLMTCDLCDGSGQALTVICPRCDGIGKIAERVKRVLPSTSRGQTFFRGALVTQKHTAKGPKR